MSHAPAASTPFFNVHTTQFEPFPEYGGGKAVLYHSDDRKVLVGSFKESGVHTLKMPFDEMIYVVGGTVTLKVDDAAPIVLGVGDLCYLRQGQTVEFTMSSDFHDVTVLISDAPIDV